MKTQGIKLLKHHFWHLSYQQLIKTCQTLQYHCYSVKISAKKMLLKEHFSSTNKQTKFQNIIRN